MVAAFKPNNRSCSSARRAASNPTGRFSSGLSAPRALPRGATSFALASAIRRRIRSHTGRGREASLSVPTCVQTRLHTSVATSMTICATNRSELKPRIGQDCAPAERLALISSGCLFAIFSTAANCFKSASASGSSAARWMSGSSLETAQCKHTHKHSRARARRDTYGQVHTQACTRVLEDGCPEHVHARLVSDSANSERGGCKATCPA
jgi:hypothetical protein